MAAVAAARPGEPGQPDRSPKLAGTSLRARLAVLMVVGAVLLVVVGSLSGLALTRLVEARHTLIGQVDPAGLEADQLLVAYLDEETGVRGYVLSADPAFL
ncbi:MAG TPA: hypothetical protein VHW47_03295, partial [Acidimicrobiales bacterium]|nr:hypothetical protein [Acidimicrobiales bacterium]